ncbi:MAG: VPLPA-CTERM sorting domain-containing protein [Gammaproteobacteria bacterium]|nr:VPLPA-CTERM sorting domain-containing protein [Gammaproteobacteria bacterium]
MKITSIVLFAAALVLTNNTHAALITSDVIADSTVIDFSTQANVSSYTGTLQIGAGIENITASGSGLFTNTSLWGLGSNGTWGSNGMTYISIDSIGTMTFSFNDNLVSSVGGFINSYPNYDLSISALDINMNPLETYSITQLANIVTPGGINDGGFRGIVRDTNDIAHFTVTGYVAVLDNLTFTRMSAVPVPAAAWLFTSGLIGLIGVARKKAR